MNILLTTAILLGAPAPKDKTPPSIVGEWLVETVEQNGKVEKPPVEQIYSFTKEGGWSVLTNGRPQVTADKYELDTTKTPMMIDLLHKPISALRGRFGIVKVDGDRLTLCYNPKSDIRPTKFESTEGSSLVIFVMKRKGKD